jgi:uncharacterized protein (TIGR02145 family)
MLAAQNGVTVSNLAVDAGTVTFNVQWTNNHAPDFVWSDTVWVFVDYNKNGVMERLLVTSATASAGTVIKIPNNDKGVWVAGNARTNGSFSATVKLLTAIKDIGGACVYGSNYPPVGKYSSADKIEFTGTPLYNIVLKNNGGGTETRTESSPYTVPAGYTVQSFTDKTGAPGKLGCIPSTTYTLMASAAAYCTGSSVTFALSNTTSGRTYWLYKGSEHVNTLTSIGGAATFTGAFADAGVYTAQVIAESGYCAAVMTGTHNVSENPLPTITRSGGDANQTVTQGTAISTNIFTALNATSISHSGSLPTGVSGTATANAATYTISGTPTTATTTGTYNYTVTAANTNGCPSASISGTITVKAGTPQYAASTKTWTVGTQTWSDVVNIPSCNKTSYSASNTTADCRNDSGYGSGYLYSWVYVTNNASALCPDEWRVPTYDDFCTLDKTLRSSSSCGNSLYSVYGTTYANEWGASGTAMCVDNGSIYYNTSDFYYWSSSDFGGGSGYALEVFYGYIRLAFGPYKYHGLAVRCVKD